MNRFRSELLLATVVIAASTACAFAASDQEVIENALSAAPAAVAKDAAVVNWDMKSLKEGTNGFTCMPDDTSTPNSNDPMCMDKNAMAFLHAVMEKKEPPPGVGFGYMLKGGGNANNSDPFATAPPDGKWDLDGPHVMIFGAGEAMAGYPQPKAHPEANAPYVMYPGTPYAHLMMPVQ
jgi:hypothetical protein